MIADAPGMGEARTIGIGIDLRHDAPHHLQAAAVDFLMRAHVEDCSAVTSG